MVVADPAAELLRLVTGPGDPPPLTAGDAERRAAELLRRRFGLALPPPFIGAPSDGEPIRKAVAADGPAIAAIKWRAFGATYRGMFSDEFLDNRDIVPPVSFWVGRAMVPPSRRHALLVWGRPGTVFGYLDCGPMHPDDVPADAPADPDDIGEIYELYLDPRATGRGGGTRLLAAGEQHLAAVGFAQLELSVLVPNSPARGFYESHGWHDTGRVRHEDLGVVAFDEARYARAAPPGSP